MEKDSAEGVRALRAFFLGRSDQSDSASALFRCVGAHHPAQLCFQSLNLSQL
jgi:hypothetical protein